MSMIDVRNSDIEVIKSNFRSIRRPKTIARSDDRIIQPADSTYGTKERGESFVYDSELKVQLTDVNYAMVSKYYLQWFMLFLVHFFVFWYWPIRGNRLAQGSDICDPNGANADKCNDFTDNGYLITYYILYCAYFAISALQIRYGLPELRKGSFAMGAYTKANELLV